MRHSIYVLSLLIAVLTNAMPVVASELTHATRSLTELPEPPQGQSAWIARSMRMNGLPMTLKSFVSRLTPDALCQHYEALGRSQHVATHRTRQGEWLVLSLRMQRELVTVQAKRSATGSEGTITVSPVLDAIRLKVDTEFPHPATVAIVNLQEYDDEGMEAEHISLSSTRSVAVETQAFLDKLQRDGWRVQHHRARSGAGQVIEAQKGAQHALVNLMHNSTETGTAMVVVWKKS